MSAKQISPSIIPVLSLLDPLQEVTRQETFTAGDSDELVMASPHHVWNSDLYFPRSFILKRINFLRREIKIFNTKIYICIQGYMSFLIFCYLNHLTLSEIWEKFKFQYILVSIMSNLQPWSKSHCQDKCLLLNQICCFLPYFRTLIKLEF